MRFGVVKFFFTGNEKLGKVTHFELWFWPSFSFYREEIASAIV